MSDIESTIFLLLERINDLINEDPSFLGRVLHHKLQIMKSDFEKFQVSLIVADDWQDEDETWKTWMEAVRKFVYLTEAAIDMFTFKTPTLSRGRQFPHIIRRIALQFRKSIALRELCLNLNSINEEIRKIPLLFISQLTTIRHRRLVSISENTTDDRFSSLLAPETDFVGFEESHEKLLKHLINGDHQRLVVLIFGMAGIGKTTLAKEANNNNAAKRHFSIRAWVYVSERYSCRDLLLQAIAECSLVGDPLESYLRSFSDGELRNVLTEILNHNRYLIILDNLQERKAWDYLENALPDTGNGSRVLVTTHSSDILGLARSECIILLRRSLGKHECWQLFCKKAFSRLYACWPYNLDETGTILTKSWLTPLAVVIIRGLLSRKEPQEWQNVDMRIKWQSDAKGQISDILSLTWKDLPYDLRPCFLYTCYFPDNYQIRIKKLVQLWEAEGMLQRRGDKNRECSGRRICHGTYSERPDSNRNKNFNVRH